MRRMMGTFFFLRYQVSSWAEILISGFDNGTGVSGTVNVPESSVGENIQ